MSHYYLNLTDEVSDFFVDPIAKIMMEVAFEPHSVIASYSDSSYLLIRLWPSR